MTREITTVKLDHGQTGCMADAATMARLFELAERDGLKITTAPPGTARRFTLAPLIEVMARLRGPGGCVWDLEQTHQSLRRYLVEEVYEVLEAVDWRDEAALCEELGDLLLQIVFHARIAEERGAFSMRDVIDGVTKKLIRRHPHVFGDVTAADAAEVVLNWDAIKKQEKGEARPGALDGIPKDLPGLAYAAKLQGKAAKVGFDWPEAAPVWDKLQEELAELEEAAAADERAAVEEELGDVLFSLVNLARFLRVDPEIALNRANQKFRRRFAFIEAKVKESGLGWEAFSLARLDALWNEAKTRKIEE